MRLSAWVQLPGETNNVVLWSAYLSVLYPLGLWLLMGLAALLSYLTHYMTPCLGSTGSHGFWITWELPNWDWLTSCSTIVFHHGVGTHCHLLPLGIYSNLLKP